MSKLHKRDGVPINRAQDEPGATAFDVILSRASLEARLLGLDLNKAHKFLWALISYQGNRIKTLISFRAARNALHRATWAMRSSRWSLAVGWWEIAIERLGDDAYPGAYAELSKARLLTGDDEAAKTAALRGWLKHPRDARLARLCITWIQQHKDWDLAAPAWRTALDELGGPPSADFYQRMARACRDHRQLEVAEEFLRKAQTAHPDRSDDFDFLIETLEVALARRNWSKVKEVASAAAGSIEAEPGRASPRQFFFVSAVLLLSEHLDRAISMARLVQEQHPGSRWALAIEGVAYLRASRLKDAEKLWKEYWQRATIDQEFALQHIPPFPSAHTPSKQFFSPVPHSSGEKAQREAVRFCVYTVLFGDYDELRSPAFLPPGIDFICLTDRERSIPGWQVRVIKVRVEGQARASRLPKILPYEFLRGYDYSLYIDANVVLLTNPLEICHRFLSGRPFVAWPHPERAGVYEELEANLIRLKHEPEALLRQHAFFREESVPQQTGFIEAGFLWRDLRDPTVRQLMEKWWDCLDRFSLYRDQPSLAYLMWKTGIRPEIMPDHLGTSRDNEIYTKLPHKNSASDMGVKPAPTGGEKGSLTKIYTKSAEQRLIWVCHTAHKAVASSVMRGHQLSELTKARVPDVAVECVDERQISSQRDSILFLTKGFLKCTNVDELASLKERRNIVCVDYVDDPARQELHEYIDVYICSSLTQFVAYSKQYPDKCVHLITHHPDPRLKNIQGREDRCRIGYFGELVNARYAPELRDKISFYRVNTKVSEADWMGHLSEFNIHYAVRRHRVIDGFKPFLKGFTAAQCRSNIIVGNEDSEARYYLGSDYPYILKDDSLEAVMEMIKYAEGSFGGAEWRRGKEIMDDVRRRCAPEQIEYEVRSLLSRCQ